MLRLLVDGSALEFERYRGASDGRAPLVFLHEGLGSLTQWQGVPAALCASTGRPGLAYARAGHGRSQPSRRPRTVDYMHHEAQVVLPALLERFDDIDAPVLVGHSDGASIALIAAAQRPDAYRALVLLAPHVIVEDCTVAGIASAGEAFERDGLGQRLARHHDDIDGLFWSWHDAWMSPEFGSWNLTALLPSITAPVLVVQGVDDQYGTMAQLDLIEAAVRGGCRRAELERCGHSPHVEQREATLVAIIDFLADIG